MNFLLDTDTCSFLINGSAEQARRKFLGALDSEVRMSIVTLGELLVGCALRVKDSELRDRVSAFIAIVTPLAMDQEVASHYASIRAGLKTKGTPIGANDLWIAAHARSAGMTLVSHNTREFKRVPDLALEDWMAP